MHRLTIDAQYTTRSSSCTSSEAVHWTWANCYRHPSFVGECRPPCQAYPNLRHMRWNMWNLWVRLSSWSSWCSHSDSACIPAAGPISLHGLLCLLPGSTSIATVLSRSPEPVCLPVPWIKICPSHWRRTTWWANFARAGGIFSTLPMPNGSDRISQRQQKNLRRISQQCQRHSYNSLFGASHNFKLWLWTTNSYFFSNQIKEGFSLAPEGDGVLEGTTAEEAAGTPSEMPPLPGDDTGALDQVGESIESQAAGRASGRACWQRMSWRIRAHGTTWPTALNRRRWYPWTRSPWPWRRWRRGDRYTRNPVQILRFKSLKWQTTHPNTAAISPWLLQITGRHQRKWELLTSLSHSGLWLLLYSRLRAHQSRSNPLAETLVQHLRGPSGKQPPKPAWPCASSTMATGATRMPMWMLSFGVCCNAFPPAGLTLNMGKRPFQPSSLRANLGLWYLPQLVLMACSERGAHIIGKKMHMNSPVCWLSGVDPIALMWHGADAFMWMIEFALPIMAVHVSLQRWLLEHMKRGRVACSSWQTCGMSTAAWKRVSTEPLISLVCTLIAWPEMCQVIHAEQTGQWTWTLVCTCRSGMMRTPWLCMHSGHLRAAVLTPAGWYHTEDNRVALPDPTDWRRSSRRSPLFGRCSTASDYAWSIDWPGRSGISIIRSMPRSRLMTAFSRSCVSIVLPVRYPSLVPPASMSVWSTTMRDSGPVSPRSLAIFVWPVPDTTCLQPMTWECWGTRHCSHPWQHSLRTLLEPSSMHCFASGGLRLMINGAAAASMLLRLTCRWHWEA